MFKIIQLPVVWFTTSLGMILCSYAVQPPIGSVVGFSVELCDSWFDEWPCIKASDSHIECYKDPSPPGNQPGDLCEGDCSGFLCSGEDFIDRNTTVDIGQGYTAIDVTTQTVGCGSKITATADSCILQIDFDTGEEWCECTQKETEDPCTATEDIDEGTNCLAEPPVV